MPALWAISFSGRYDGPFGGIYDTDELLHLAKDQVTQGGERRAYMKQKSPLCLY
jgi:hypothetical protein